MRKRTCANWRFEKCPWTAKKEQSQSFVDGGNGPRQGVVGGVMGGKWQEKTPHTKKKSHVKKNNGRAQKQGVPKGPGEVATVRSTKKGEKQTKPTKAKSKKGKKPG